MTEILLFAALALLGVWARDRLATIGVAGAAILALSGLAEQGWIGWVPSAASSFAYVCTTLAMIGALLAVAIARSQFLPSEIYEGKLLRDVVGKLAWGCVQQAVLIAWLAQVDPVLAVVVFAVIHLPNLFLVGVTLVGGAVSVAIACWLGVNILAAAISHAVLSTFISYALSRDWHRGMCVGRGCRGR